MANGNTIAEIREILSDKTKVSQGVVNRLTLSLMAEIYEKQVKQGEEDAAHKVAVDKRLAELERRSVGMWAWNHPKSAFAILIFTFSFLISDIRQPAVAWLTEFFKLVF